MQGLKITVSVEVRIVNPFVCLVIQVRLPLNFNAYTFGHCVIFSGKKITAPQVRICPTASSVAYAHVYAYAAM